MAESFLSENFLLTNETGRKLYHEIAAGLPVIDYHSHLPPGDIAQNRQFSNITELWLDGDHYKWRAMRAMGISEEFISGKASPKEKFQKWGETVPHTIRNPLYHWTHLELKRYFGIDDLLNGENADEIYDKTSALLNSNSLRTLSLLETSHVEIVCTSDDPCDSLEYHDQIAKNPDSPKVLPTFRLDQVLNFSDPAAWNAYIISLELVSGQSIAKITLLVDALFQRIAVFHAAGCRLSDHGITHFEFVPPSISTVQNAFQSLRSGNEITREQHIHLRSFLLTELSKEYHKRGWTQQFHIGAFRALNTRMTNSVGANAGCDSIADYQQGPGLARFLDTLDKTDQLPKTILYNLNPADSAMFATMAGNFNDGSIKGKMQYGPAWWFLDQKNGIQEHLDIVSNYGLLSNFVGMLTDSRSFLSYSRHEYFRRILCDTIGRDVENGEIPNDQDLLSTLISNICYHNARDYLKL